MANDISGIQIEYPRFKSYDEVIVDELSRSIRSTLRAFSPHFYQTETPKSTGERANANVAKPNHLKE